MILSCPDCHTRFAVDAAHLAPEGRRVKCGKCAHIWFESMPEPEADQPSPIEVTPYDPGEDSGDALASVPALRRPRSGHGARTAWVVSAVLLVAILAVLWFGRGPIALAVPQAEAVYASIGIDAFPPPGEGLEVEFNVSAEGGELALMGEVINISNGARDIPVMHVLISNADNNMLKTWSFMTETRRLGPGERAPFTTQTDEIPAGAANVSVLFTNPEENR